MYSTIARAFVLVTSAGIFIFSHKYTLTFGAVLLMTPWLNKAPAGSGAIPLIRSFCPAPVNTESSGTVLAAVKCPCSSKESTALGVPSTDNGVHGLPPGSTTLSEKYSATVPELLTTIASVDPVVLPKATLPKLYPLAYGELIDTP